MKIFIVGSFKNGDLGASYLAAFRSLGYEPSIFDIELEYKKSSFLTINRYTNRIIMPYAVFLINKKLLKQADSEKPKFIFIIKEHFINSKTLSKMKSITGAKIFLFNPDNPFIYNGRLSVKETEACIPLYDAYFTYSEKFIPELGKAGVKKVEFLPFAYDPDLHHPVLVSDEDRKFYGNDVAFVGNWNFYREKYLSALRGYRLSIWGTNYWDTRCEDDFLRQCWRRRIVVGDEMSRVLQSSKINLNILNPLNNKDSHNMRTFEIPACGGFMLHERSSELIHFLEEGKEVECFDSPEELKDKINFYLKNDNLRQKIASAGYRKIINSNSTYKDRAARILKAYEDSVRII